MNDPNLVILTDQNKGLVIERINALPGPKVKFVNPIVGFGLFADRDYQPGEFVAFYGGIKKKKTQGDGPYVVEGRSYAYDAEHKFDIRDKGRWVNENPVNERDYNVDMMFRTWEKNLPKFKGKRLFFVTKKKVPKGTEFFWWYGTKYDRPWKVMKNCAFCDDPTAGLMYSKTKLVFCDRICQINKILEEEEDGSL